MKELEINLNTIARMGKVKEDENYDFRAFLKGQEPDEVDEIVHRLHKEITGKINCLDCGNCCESLSTGVTDDEINILSKIEGLSVGEFVEKFIEEDQYSPSKYLKDVPCRYLKGKVCSVYEQRPNECKTYPNTHKSNFISRTFFIIENYSICPIVYNIYENLKTELGYS